MEAPICATCAFQAEVESDIKKFAHDLSLANEHCNGEKSNKRQIVLWNPTLAQLLEMRESLVFGTTNFYQSKSAISNNYPFVNMLVFFFLQK